MVREAVSEELPADCDTVFDLVHDYDRRLQWDTLLREAFVEGGRPAGKGEVAAVKMVNRPPLFERWAASIRHERTGEHRSRIVYTYNFAARPRWLASVLEPILAVVFRWETRRRLRALRTALLASPRPGA